MVAKQTERNPSKIKTRIEREIDGLQFFVDYVFFSYALLHF
jgi:uncharacterized protein YfcZ (UPF0381/DUF406 family)